MHFFLACFYVTFVIGEDEDDHENKDLSLKKIDARIQKIMTVRSNLQDPAFQSKVLQAAQADLSSRYREFTDKLDHNPDLVVFNNKVYELSTGTIRNPKPQDYVSTHVGYEYDEVKMKDPDTRTEIYKALHKVFPQLKNELL